MADEAAPRALVSGSVWMALAEGASTIGLIASSVAAARVLQPHDFGLLGTAMLALAILENFSTSGLQQALIQRPSTASGGAVLEGDASPADLHSDLLDAAWTWQLGRGALLALVYVTVAPWLGDLYGQPELPAIMWTCATVPILNGLANIGVVALSRALDFRRLAYAQTLRAALQLGVSLPAIFLLRNVWALVLGNVAGAAVGCAISYLVHPYRPRLRFDFKALRGALGYGKWVSVATAIAFVVTQGDDLFVSKYLGVYALGLYQLAFHHSNSPGTKVAHVLNQVAFPTYSRIASDPDQLRTSFLGVLRGTVLLCSVLTVSLYSAIPHVVAHLLGAKWAPVVPLVRILAISGFARAITALGGALFLAVGKPELDVRMNVPRLVVLVATVWPLTARYGLDGTCLAVALSTFACFIVWFPGVRAATGLGAGTLVRTAASSSLAALLLGAIARSLDVVFDDELTGSLATLGGAVAIWLLVLWPLARIVPNADIFATLRTLRRKEA